MTPDKNFKMKKSTKIMLALAIGTSESRGSLKRAMIDSQLREEAAKRASLKSKDNDRGAAGTKSRGAVAPE